MSIDTLISEKIEQSVAPLITEIKALQEEIRNLQREQTQDMNVEITGVRHIMKAMGITDKHVMTHLIRTGVLGNALWKVPTKRGNGKVYCTPAIAKSRYQRYLCKPENVRKAMETLGIDLSEKKWKEQGL